MSGDILDDIDAAIEEHEGYVEWHGSADSATWTADGSHEVETSGHYYGDDLPGRSNPWPVEAWQQILDSLRRPLDREVFDPSRQFQARDEVTILQLSRYQELINRMHRNQRAFTTAYDAIVDEAGHFYWQGLTEPDPAEFVRETVATWEPGEAPTRPIEAVLREIVREQG